MFKPLTSPGPGPYLHPDLIHARRTPRAWRYPARCLRRAAVAVVLLAALAGCQAGPETAALEGLRNTLFKGRAPEPVLNPAFAYLRVTLQGNVAYLALGATDPHPQGPTENWFTATGEVLRLRDGRIADVLGTAVEWREVRHTGWPGWAAALAVPTLATTGLEWTRERDVMPGYRYRVVDRLRLRPIPPPSRSQLQRLAPASLQWFEERNIESRGGESRGGESRIGLPSRGAVEPLPPARYALEWRDGQATVVYGEQCLRADFCLSWQRWAAAR